MRREILECNTSMDGKPVQLFRYRTVGVMCLRNCCIAKSCSCRSIAYESKMFRPIELDRFVKLALCIDLLQGGCNRRCDHNDQSPRGSGSSEGVAQN